MNTMPHARGGLTTAQETLQTVLLIIVSFVSAWMLHIAPWQAFDDPCLLATIATAVVMVLLWVTRWQGFRALSFERNLLLAFLVGMPLVYVTRYLLDSTGRVPQHWLWMEILGLIIFTALAILGLKRSPWFLAVGIVAHGLAWDSWHYGNSTYIPDWYAIACLAVDLALGAYVAARVPAYQSPSRIEAEK